MTESHDSAVPSSVTPRGAGMRSELIARSDAWHVGRCVRRTILASALTGNTRFLDGLANGIPLTVEMYDRCMAGLDDLDRLDAVAGFFIEPSRRGRGKPAEATKEALRARVDSVAAAIGVRSPLVALAVTRDSTLIHANGCVSQAQYLAYERRLDAIEAAFAASRTGDRDGEAEAGTTTSAGHRREGEAVHRPD
jgi:hypothetical protein